MGNNKFSIASVGNRRAFRDGARDGVPIALGYFAVSFSLGIVARNVGMTPIQGMITSALCNASAGEYAGFTMIAAGAAYIEMAIVTLMSLPIPPNPPPTPLLAIPRRTRRFEAVPAAISCFWEIRFLRSIVVPVRVSTACLR